MVRVGGSIVPHEPVKRVLFVDDDEDVAGLLAAFYQSTGCDVRVATSGSAAIAVALDWRADVVVLDLRLGDRDGCDVARRILASSAPRIVALTGSDDDDDGARALAAGCCDLLVKPPRLDVLTRLIADA